MVTAFLFFGGAAFVIAATLALAFASSWSRTAVLMTVTLVVPVVLVGIAYFSAPTDARESNCSDCGLYWGRWWEPALVIVGSLFNVLAWAAGVGAGALLRRLTVGRGRTPTQSQPFA